MPALQQLVMPPILMWLKKCVWGWGVLPNLTPVWMSPSVSAILLKGERRRRHSVSVTMPVNLHQVPCHYIPS